jgi:16S rRNA G966 N2-methylase RsmD
VPVNLSIRSVSHKLSPGQLIAKRQYAALVRGLSSQEYQSLKKSIKENGQHVPIIVNSENIILDGHHRFRICKELGIKPITVTRKFENEDKLQEQLFVINCAVEGRQLNDFEKIELRLKAKPIIQKIAKQNESRGGKGVRIHTPLGRVDKELGKSIGLSHDTVHKVDTILKKAPPETLGKLRTGTESINHVYKSIVKEERKQNLVNQTPAISLPDGIKIVYDDFIEYGKNIPNDSIDLIFTDPPYALESIPIYVELGIVAQRILKPGGSLVTYVGHRIIPDVIHQMENSGLTYWWIIAVKLSGPFSRSFDRGISIKWKPLLWFVKGEKRNAVDFMSDYIESSAPEKVLHEWEQSTTEAEHIISRLTVENQIIFDPFTGSGTTGIAAINLRRKFIGTEKEPDKFKIVKARINKFLLKEAKNKK